MNAQNTQVIQNRTESEIEIFCESTTQRLHRQTDNLIQAIKTYFANRLLANSLAGMSDKLQRDIGLDDPQKQMHLFDRNFNTIAELRHLERNRHLFR